MGKLTDGLNRPGVNAGDHHGHDGQGHPRPGRQYTGNRRRDRGDDIDVQIDDLALPGRPDDLLILGQVPLCCRPE